MLQPARLGDIIILLPIAKKYHDLGYEVVWPVWRQCSFFLVHAPYVTWRILPVDYHKPTQIKAAAPDVDKWLEPLFGFYGTESVTLGWKRSGITFDAYKYLLCVVVPTEKDYEFSRLRGTNLYDHKEILLKVYPELRGVVTTAAAGIRRGNCKGCARNKYTNPITAQLMSMKYDGRDLSSLIPIIGNQGVQSLQATAW